MPREDRETPAQMAERLEKMAAAVYSMSGYVTWPPPNTPIHSVKERAALSAGAAALRAQAQGPDGCQICAGTRGGVPGNENLINGISVCDYCRVDMLHHRPLIVVQEPRP